VTASSSRLARPLQTDSAAAIAAVASVAYYVGSLLGLELRLPPATTSVLWPPNAILTAILLFVRPTQWWSVLFGAALAHFAVQLPVWSPAFVAAIFLTNCGEALLAAGLMRYFSDEPSKFDTLRRVSIFLAIGGFLAPFASSFLDAGVVTLINREDYWTVWKLRFPSNMLAELAIVPAVAGFLNSSANILQWPRGRWLETAAIAGGFVVVSFAVSFDVGRIGLSHAPLAPFLPFLLWTAVRFGSAGVGLSVLATVLLAVVSALHGDGLFLTISSENRIGTLQVFLISATVPLMCLGALVEERQKAVVALRSADTLKLSILNSIPSLVAVIGRDGRILAVNEACRTASDKGVISDFSGEPGASYLELWRAAATRGVSNARAGYDGITSVLDGSVPRFAFEYCSGANQWWMMSAVPLKSPDGGAVITHTDISARKRAEAEAQRSRDELTHATRVWVMGELTASLSHQLNQPLTGIVGNASAGRRFLDANPPNLGEVRQILIDIVDDAQRAADVTRTIRDMLQKDVSEDEALDLNDVVRDTTRLVTSEALIRDVGLRLEFASALPLVRGKRVQLRQVVLNLIINAIEAAAEHVTGPSRVVLIGTEPTETHSVQVSVTDTGRGLPAGAEEQVFEPLFTTKESGMGMGLPIARAIVEAHGGRLWAANASGGGTIFRFTVPVDDSTN
jgi:nitrogen-specific signal transduction histidine kinase/integral membrane sensor domain MASE1